MKKFILNPSLNNVSVFLLLIFPASLVIGPFVAEVVMNLINIFFLIKTLKSKKFTFLKDKFFIFFILFYFYIFITIIFSNYVDKILFKHIFYFRHIIFVFAIVDLLKINERLILKFYKFLSITILIVCIDGIFQFIFDYNLLGFPQIRPDRLTGFFGDKMILGSYVARFLPLLLGLFIYNFKFLNKKYYLLGCGILIISFLTIILSGERMAFISTLIYLICVSILLNFAKKIKILLIFTVLSMVTIIISFSPTLLDRHFQQTIDQVNFKFNTKDIFSNFNSYSNIYKTSYNGFLNKKIIGQGARSFRYFCSEKHLESFSNSKLVLNPKTNQFQNPNIKYLIIDIHFDQYEMIKKDKILFTYLNKEKEKIDYVAHFDGQVFSSNLFSLQNKHIYPSSIWWVVKILKNGCTTHPHNFYLQLISETGFVGFVFLSILFGYLVFLICKNFMAMVYLKKRSNYTNYQICLLLGFVITLLPISPNGNFFNNWLSMVMFLPVGFYIHSIKIYTK